ncbi:hypothetical protein ANCCEY_09697 [Ancylostoma ceylanicum]|uniref:Uncharacterized protein n=1 Tax=Ancylostoma ceylanicum TaxID=53326 RepID=A0A0D6LGT2_9BILA|nr:hypothetical protein ANCCEY_09697 [Ancylostoma ceylanicum]
MVTTVALICNAAGRHKRDDRDARRFHIRQHLSRFKPVNIRSLLFLRQGIPGLQAPPPYPPPPSYSQIQNFPELPTVSNARLDNRTPSRSGKKSEITPVE